MNIEVFLDWVKDIECFFDYMGTPDDRNVKLVSLKQKGGISAWWDQVNTIERCLVYNQLEH